MPSRHPTTAASSRAQSGYFPDEHGIHRQGSTATHGTLLRGPSFLASINQHRRSRRGDSSASHSPASSREGSPSVSSTGGGVVLLSAVQSPARDSGDLAREPTMLHNSDKMLPSPLPEKLYTVVLDLDETLIYGREGCLTARAHLKTLLRTLAELTEVVAWTAGERSYAKAVVKEINTEGAIKHLVYRDDVWFNAESYTKDLRQLGRDTDYVLIVENTPDCVRVNPRNGIIVSDFEGSTTRQDSTLLKLADLVRAMVKSQLPVPRFLPTCRLLRRQVVESEEGNEIPIFFLSGRPRKEAAPSAASAAAAKQGEEVDDDEEAEGKVVRKNLDRKGGGGSRRLSGLNPELEEQPPAAQRPPRSEAAYKKTNGARTA